MEFTNKGAQEANESVTLGSTLVKAVYGHRLTPVHLQPNASATYEMERRECPLHFGESKEMKDCAECDPILIFLK